MGVDGSHDLSGLGDINRSSEVLQWDLSVDGSSVKVDGTRSDVAESWGFSIIRYSRQRPCVNQLKRTYPIER